jgi:hypothetical protein
VKKNDNLKTPEWVYSKLGCIDLDPCAGIDTDIGKNNFCIELGEDGLKLPWKGFVYCNPPFSEKEKWASKMIEHKNGILILPERGSAPWFGPLALEAGAYWVMGKKINFIGGPSSNNLGSALFLFGDEAKQRLLNGNLTGHYVEVKKYIAR